jgi:hypothetical protein
MAETERRIIQPLQLAYLRMDAPKQRQHPDLPKNSRKRIQIQSAGWRFFAPPMRMNIFKKGRRFAQHRVTLVGSIAEPHTDERPNGGVEPRLYLHQFFVC